MRTTPPIKVFIVDDHPFFRKGVLAVLQGEEDFSVAGEAADGVEAIEGFRKCRPDVTLVDLQMPLVSGIETIKTIRQEFPEARFIVLTTYLADIQVTRALEAGASGYLLKGALRNQLLDTIRAVHAGKRVIPAEVAVELAHHALDEPLSEREVEVLRRVAVGTSNREIAAELALTEATIKSHMKSILNKLGANDRTHAVMIAVKRGFIDG
jgi:DNA-binding NarL/FixJ family response regulator